MKRIFLLAVLLAGCCVTLEAQVSALLPIQNIPYREADGDAYIDSMCRMDLYVPADKKDFSTVVWFHGGGLTGGHREIPEGLKDSGFAVVGVGYRFTPRVQVTACIEDAAAAAAWVVEHIDEYGGDARRIIIAGHSAGGYLALMIGLDKRWMAPYGIDPDTAFAALIPYSGMTSTHFARRRELGLKDTQLLVDDLAPLNHVRADAPPMLILSGDREQELLGRYEEAAYFGRMMHVAGHPNVRFYEFDGFGHGNMPQAGHFVTVRYLHEMELRSSGK